MTRRRGPSGFTLVEMLIAMGMLAAVVSASVGMIIGMNASTRHVRIIGDAQTGARMGLEQLAAEIRAAGAGVSTGEVGIAPGGGSARRLPVIYSGPNVTITEPGGQTIVTNSIFIVSSNPTFFGVDVSSANQRSDTGTMGIVTAASSGVPLTVVCYGVSGGAVDCKNDLLPTPLPALLIGDFRNAVYLSPKTLQSPAGVPPTQQLDYFEVASNAYSPDPKAPFGFTPGSAMLRARVTHWYLRQTAGGDPQLVRSYPTLTTTALNAACAASDVPFIDETNAVAGVAGTEMGTVPIDSLQIRFVTDPTGADNPAQFTMVNSITVCDTLIPATLREVRMQIVSRTANWDLQGQSTEKKINYATPGYEGTTPTPGAGGVTQDSYPRRAFNLAVVPRTLQGYRL